MAAAGPSDSDTHPAAATATAELLSYTITSTLPTPTEFIHLRTAAGLTPPPAAAVPKALQHTLHCVVARLDAPSAQAIGMLRLVGDGALTCHLSDMAVDPAFQRRGIGRALLEAMVAWIDEHAPDAYVSLIGDPPGQALYRKAGFVNSLGIGMKRSRWGN